MRSALPPLHLVTVDLDETLWPLMPTLELAESALYSWLQKHAPVITDRHTIQSLYELRLEVVSGHPELAHDVTAVRHKVLAAVCQQFGLAHTIADEAMRVFLAARNRVQPFSEVPEVLQGLSRHTLIASVTNGNADVKQTGLAEFIGLALTAANTGAAKPAPAMFRAALAWADTVPDNALHVGDDPELDIVPAKALGMKTVWVNRTQRTWPQSLPRPDLEVSRLDAITISEFFDTP